MSRTHICLGCGFELARVHAPPDPHYGLPIVVCPRCQLACVRHPKDPLIAFFHNSLRLRRAALSLAAQLMLAVAIIASLTGLGAVFTGEFLLDHRVTAIESLRLFFAGDLGSTWYGRGAAGELSTILVGFTASAIFTGAWLTACFGHVRTGRLWLGTAAAIIIGTPSIAAIFYFGDSISYSSSVTVAEALPPAHDVVTITAMAGLFMLIAPLGIPIGRGLKRVWASGAKAGRRRTRARLRRIREGL